MTLDPLHIMLVLDAVIILAALIFMVRRPKAQPSEAIPSEPPTAPPAESVPDSDVIRRSLILRMLQDKIREIEQTAGFEQKGDNPDSKAVLLDQIYDLNLDLLKNLEACLRQEDANPIESISETLTVQFRVSVNDRLLAFMRSLEDPPH